MVEAPDKSLEDEVVMDQNESEEIAVISAQGDIVYNADLTMAEAQEVINTPNAPELIEDAE